MVGLLDLLTGQTGASPWGALYPTQAGLEADQAQQARDAAAAVLARRFRAPQVAAPDAAPAPGAFGAGATPFSFAGPGSMNVDPSIIAPAPPAAPPSASALPVAPGPVMPAPPAAAATAPRPARGPDGFISVGDYQMPTFGPTTGGPSAPTPAPSPAPGGTPGATSPAAPFSLGGAGAVVGDRLMKATRGFLGNLGNGPIGALAGGVGALVTGQNTDPSSIAAEQNSAMAKALVDKGASLVDVQAARNNKELMNALIQQFYGKDKWSVVKVGQDENGRETYMQQNQVDGTLRPLPRTAGPSYATADTVTGPDGKPIPIPPGVDRKEFIKRVSGAVADAATGKATEAQNKASSFAARMDQAEAILGKLQNQGLSVLGKGADAVPVVGNYLQSPEYRQYKQAASAFITAMLRQESGAAINKSEFDRYEKEMFPQPGDDPATVQQKAQMRAAATEQMRRAARPGYQPPAAAGGAAAAGSAPRGTVNVGGKSIDWSVN